MIGEKINNIKRIIFILLLNLKKFNDLIKNKLEKITSKLSSNLNGM
jgi:hypothetical protein